MIRVATLWLFVSTLLFCAELQSHYFFKDNTITPYFLLGEGYENNTTLFTIAKESSHYKISTLKLLKFLKKAGISLEKPHFSYVTFDKKSPIDTSKIQAALKSYYAKALPSLEIQNIVIYPRSYVNALPPHFSVHVPKNSFKRYRSTLYIQDTKRKRIFFNYEIEGILHVIKNRHQLERKDSINSFNTYKSTQPFSSLTSKPLLHVDGQRYIAKHRLKADTTLYDRDVTTKPLVKKDEDVNVIITQGDLELQTTARALQDGKLYDMIRVEKSDGTRMRVKVIGVNQVELQ